MCEPQIDARRAERKIQCASTGRHQHQHARRKHTQQEDNRLMRPAKKNTLVNGRWFILLCNKAQINATYMHLLQCRFQNSNCSCWAAQQNSNQWPTSSFPDHKTLDGMHGRQWQEYQAAVRTYPGTWFLPPNSLLMRMWKWTLGSAGPLASGVRVSSRRSKMHQSCSYDAHLPPLQVIGVIISPINCFAPVASYYYWTKDRTKFSAASLMGVRMMGASEFTSHPWRRKKWFLSQRSARDLFD